MQQEKPNGTETNSRALTEAVLEKSPRDPLPLTVYYKEVLAKTLLQIAHTDEGTPLASRKKARELAQKALKSLEKIGMPVHFHGFENGDDAFNQSTLIVMNHQAYGLEAILAYAFLPLDTTIVLKDDLVHPPGSGILPIIGKIGNGFKSIDPIIFKRTSNPRTFPWTTEQKQRDVAKGARKAAIRAIKSVKNGIARAAQSGHVCIFPEGTRSKDGSIHDFIRVFPRLINAARTTHKNSISVITCDTFPALPFSPEKKLTPKAYPVPIHFYLHTISIDDKTDKELSKEIHTLMESTLRTSLQKRIS